MCARVHLIFFAILQFRKSFPTHIETTLTTMDPRCAESKSKNANQPGYRCIIDKNGNPRWMKVVTEEVKAVKKAQRAEKKAAGGIPCSAKSVYAKNPNWECDPNT